jgi:NADPH:quinone reductase-like Zn-dependent oxidoreductase
VAIRASNLAPKPKCVDHAGAAAASLSGLTVWQALFVHGNLSSGQNVLVHGAAGAVGVFAVQLARWRGARVSATADARDADFLRALVLLCHKRRTQQNGQHVSRLSSNLASWIRRVAIEYGLCRSARMRRAAGPELGRNFLGA